MSCQRVETVKESGRMVHVSRNRSAVERARRRVRVESQVQVRDCVSVKSAIFGIRRSLPWLREISAVRNKRC